MPSHESHSYNFRSAQHPRPPLKITIVLVLAKDTATVHLQYSVKRERKGRGILTEIVGQWQAYIDSLLPVSQIRIWVVHHAV